MGAVDGEFGVVEAGEEGALDDELVDGECGGVDGVVSDAADILLFFRDDFVIYEVEIVVDDLLDADDVVWVDEIVNGVDDEAHGAEFTNVVCHEGVGWFAVDEWAAELVGDDFELDGINDGSGGNTEFAADLETEDGVVEEF